MRLERLRALLEQEQLDAVLMASPANIRYFSGFTGRDSFAYISAKKQVILTDSRYTLQAEEEGPGFQVLTIGPDRAYGVLLEQLLREEQVVRLGFEDGAMLYNTVAGLQEKAGIPNGNWIPMGDKLSMLRVIKDEEEISCMARAQEVADATFAYILDYLKPGVTELEIAAKMEYFMRTHGADDKGFDTIVASGYHSAMPHAIPTGKKLEEGDFVTMDFGCNYKGYISDMTRTVVIGKASEKQKEIYSIVLEAQLAALKGLRPGLTGKEADHIARDIIEKAGYGAYFGHGLGHSVGLEVHERPGLSMREQTVLQAGTIETVEPGIYVPGIGGVRIEDMVVLTENGCRNLTHSPKELLEL